MFIQYITFNTNEDTFNSKKEVQAYWKEHPQLKVFVDLFEISKANGLVVGHDIIIDPEINNIHTLMRSYPSYDAYLTHVVTISNQMSDDLTILLREKGWTVTYTLNDDRNSRPLLPINV